MLPRYNKTIVARCDWVHGFRTPWGANGTLGFASGAIFPIECTKHHGSRHSVQQLYTGNLLFCCRAENV